MFGTHRQLAKINLAGGGFHRLLSLPLFRTLVSSWTTQDSWSRSPPSHNISICSVKVVIISCISSRWYIAPRHLQLHPPLAMPLLSPALITIVPSILAFQRFRLGVCTATRVIGYIPKFGRVSEYMRTVLHWLPFPQQIIYKVSALAWHCLQGLTPLYLRELRCLTSGVQRRATLRSAVLLVPHLVTGPAT